MTPRGSSTGGGGVFGGQSIKEVNGELDGIRGHEKWVHSRWFIGKFERADDRVMVDPVVTRRYFSKPAISSIISCVAVIRIIVTPFTMSESHDLKPPVMPVRAGRPAPALPTAPAGCRIGGSTAATQHGEVELVDCQRLTIISVTAIISKLNASEIPVPMNINLTPQLEDLVRSKVASGLYNSASEVVREALRLMEREDQVRTAALTQLRQEIQLGLDSPSAGELDIEAIKSRGRERLAARPAQ